MSADLKAQLFHYFDLRRGEQEIGSLSLLEGWLKSGPDPKSRLQAWLETLGAGNGKESDMFLSSPELASFMARLGAMGGGFSVLDPTCGSGLLLAEAAGQLNATVVHGADINPQFVEISCLVLGPAATIFRGNSVLQEFEARNEYDLLISEPPFCLKTPAAFEHPHVEFPLPNVADALLYKWGQRLSSRGRAVFLMPASCLSSTGKKMWHGLATLGLHLRALIHVPSGCLKATTTDAYIAVVDRTAREEIFTAQFGRDEKLQKQLLSNYRNHRREGKLAQGQLVKLDPFRGFKAMEAAKRLTGYAKRAGLEPVTIVDLAESFDVVRRGDSPPQDGDNDVYLPLEGRCQAVQSMDEIGTRRGSVIRMALNSDKADARYVAESLNDELGRMFLQSVSRPTNSIMSLDAEVLRGAIYYLPPREIQARVMEARSRILALRAELDEIDSQLRAQPGRVEKLAQQVERLNHEDTLKGWLESLPFPLASILWRYLACNDETRERNEILLHFFEALAEFWATVFLSAAKSDPAFWSEQSADMHEAIAKGKLSFDLATFGLWSCIVGFLRRRFEALAANDLERCARMFATPSREVLEMLLDPRMAHLLQTANSIRNGTAHGGAQAPGNINIAHSQLFDLVQTCRSIMGRTWERYELVEPGNCRFVGGVMHYRVSRLMGNATPFMKAERRTVEGMEDGHLHLLDPEGDRARQLLPFVRVMPSPKTASNACYFYNKTLSGQQHFVSYHFEAEAEINDRFEDTREALESLKPFGISAESPPS